MHETMPQQDEDRAGSIEQRVERRKQPITAGSIRQAKFSCGWRSPALLRTSVPRIRPATLAKIRVTRRYRSPPKTTQPCAVPQLRRSEDSPASARASIPKLRQWETARRKSATAESGKD